MTPTSRSAKAAPANATEGLEDLTRSVRVLARNSRNLVTDAGEVLERELAMAVEVSERLRAQTVSDELLSEARAVRVQAGLRQSAHGVVDLVADAVGVATVSAIRFVETMVDQPRPAAPRAASDASADEAAVSA